MYFYYYYTTTTNAPLVFLISGTISAKLSLEFDAYKNSKLAFPIGVTATASGNIIIADTSQDMVMVFDPNGRGLHKATFCEHTHFLIYATCESSLCAEWEKKERSDGKQCLSRNITANWKKKLMPGSHEWCQASGKKLS